jgi:hypothetical protein
MTDRHRPSEPYSPRPSDLIADRLRVLAAWATLNATTVTIDGAVFDGAAFEELAEQQARDEVQLLEHWKTFRAFYANYTETLRARETILLAAIAEVSKTRSDTETKKALRLCRLRRPPLAKVSAMVAAARRRTGTSG